MHELTCKFAGCFCAGATRVTSFATPALPRRLSGAAASQATARVVAAAPAPALAPATTPATVKPRRAASRTAPMQEEKDDEEEQGSLFQMCVCYTLFSAWESLFV